MVNIIIEFEFVVMWSENAAKGNGGQQFQPQGFQMIRHI